MKRAWWMYTAAGVVIAAGAFSFLPAAAASAKERSPGPPSAVLAVSTAGVRGVSVVWKAPTSVGSSPILYYLATTRNGKYVCTASVSGTNSCRIPGPIGRVHYAIQVRAMTAAGPGLPKTVLSFVARPSGTTPSSGTTQTAPSGTTPYTPAQREAAAALGNYLKALEAAKTSATDPPPTSQLPFTGIDVETLLLVGLSLVIAGLLLISTADKRRRTLRRIAILVHPGWIRS